jgi:hypothetical protein
MLARRGAHGARRSAVLVILAVVLAVTQLTLPLGAAPANAAAGDPSLDQCFSGATLAGCTATGPDFSGVDVQLSPDGRHLYVLGRSTPAIRLFDRGALNKLTPRAGSAGCYNATGSGSCTAVPALTSPDIYDVTISPDGKSVYVAGLNSLILLVRDPGTGALTYSGCYGPGAGCTAVVGLPSVLAVAVSPDNANVYARGNGGIAVFDRNVSSGALTQKPAPQGCFSESPTTGCTDSFGLAGNAFSMTVSADGHHLYYPIQDPGGIGFFLRGGDGTLSQIAGPQGGCITTTGASSAAGECAVLGDGSGPAMGNAWATTVSDTGGHVFVSGMGGTVVFNRAADTGKLTKTDCVALNAISGCQQVAASAGMGVVVSPDGHRAVIGSNDVGGVGVYDFNATTGQLTRLPAPLGCFSGSGATGCTAVPGGSQYGKSSFTPDGLNVYFVANGPLINLAIDAAPVCQAVSATVPSGKPTPVHLSCTDANGDALTINTPSQTSAGQLGAVDQASGNVLYNPFSGYSGTDTFTYTATAKGTTSAPATVTIHVQRDTAVTLQIGSGTIKLDSHGKGKVALTCPASEASGPCSGTLTVSTRGKVPVNGKQKTVVLGSAKFRIASGATQAVDLKLKSANFSLVQKVSSARKVVLQAAVVDAVGNKATVTKKGKVKLPA